MPKLYRRINRNYKAGQTLFHEGEASDGMYIIRTGLVSVYKTRKRGGEEVDTELLRLGPNDVFGEMSLIGDGMREASVRALKDTEVTVVTKEMFADQCANLPPWAANLMRILVGRLKLSNEKFLHLAPISSALPADFDAVNPLGSPRNAPGKAPRAPGPPDAG